MADVAPIFNDDFVTLKGATDDTPIGNVGEDLKVIDEEAIAILSVIAGITSTVFKKTYSASIGNLIAASSATDFFTISGSATKKIKVLAMIFSGTKTNSSFEDLYYIKRSTLNSGGTFTNPTIVPNDSTNPAATAVITAYTENPTLGALVGVIRSEKIYLANKNSSAPNSTSIADFTNIFSQPYTLNNANESLCLNFNGVTHSGSDLNVTCIWTEE
jgi:hypothetical protein